MLEVTGRSHALACLWADAFEGVIVRHPNPSSTPRLVLVDGVEPVLRIEIKDAKDTRDLTQDAWKPFVVSNVVLTFFPGARVARMWLAAAWAGYLQHEALELVTFGPKPILDPHQDPYPTCPWNRGLRDGMPPVLTPDTLVRALATVMPLSDAYNEASS